MNELIFLINEAEINIKCQGTDNMKEASEKFSSLINRAIEDLSFTYNGVLVDFNLKINEQINEEDKQEGKMKIIVSMKENKENFNKEEAKIQATDILCPTCGELCFIKNKDFKIILYGCKNGHKIDNISLKKFKELQKIDLSKVICDECKEFNKATANNIFFTC